MLNVALFCTMINSLSGNNTCLKRLFYVLFIQWLNLHQGERWWVAIAGMETCLWWVGPPITWNYQICRDMGVTVTEALQLAEDRPFWWAMMMWLKVSY